jgi:integral membrane protein
MSPTRRFRWIAFLEGVSLIVLVGIGVPLKHFGHEPIVVRVVGPIHGLLFLAYLWAVSDALGAKRWTRGQAAWAVVAAFLPFGTFVLDARLRREEREIGGASAAASGAPTGGA